MPSTSRLRNTIGTVVSRPGRLPGRPAFRYPGRTAHLILLRGDKCFTYWIRQMVGSLGPSPGVVPNLRAIHLQSGSLPLCFQCRIQVPSGSLRCFSGTVRRSVRPCLLPLGRRSRDCFAEREYRRLQDGRKRLNTNRIDKIKPNNSNLMDGSLRLRGGGPSFTENAALSSILKIRRPLILCCHSSRPKGLQVRQRVPDGLSRSDAL